MSRIQNIELPRLPESATPMGGLEVVDLFNLFSKNPVFDWLLDQHNDDGDNHMLDFAAAKPADKGMAKGGKPDKWSNEADTTSNQMPDTYISGQDTPDGFNIAITFSGNNWTNSTKQAVMDASEFLSDVITNDLPDGKGVDDVHFTFTLSSIDGTGGHLGHGGVVDAREGSETPYESFVDLDVDDVTGMTDAMVFDIVLHEMLHGLGFGTKWNEMGLVSAESGEERFIGSNATAVYNDQISQLAQYDDDSASGVPLSNDEMHWDHYLFRREIMTDKLYLDGNHLTDLSLAAMEDMGYNTTWDGDTSTGEDILLF